MSGCLKAAGRIRASIRWRWSPRSITSPASRHSLTVDSRPTQSALPLRYVVRIAFRYHVTSGGLCDALAGAAQDCAAGAGGGHKFHPGLAREHRW